MSLGIRQAGVDDLDSVVEILREAADWLVAQGMPLWKGDELSEESVAAEVAAGLFFVAVRDDVAIGVMRFQLEDPLFWPDASPGEAVYVHRLAVRRTVAGGGVSTALMTWAVERAATLGRRFVRLDTEADRTRLRSIYERFGFRHHSDRRVGPYYVARYEYAIDDEPTLDRASMLDLETTTDRELDEAIDANLVTHLTWVSGRMAGTRVEISPSVVLVDSGFDCDTFNVACRTRFASDPATRVAEALRFFDETGRDFSWWCGPIDEPTELDAFLGQAGLTCVGTEVGMVCDLSRIRHDERTSGLQVARAHSADGIADYASVVAANWDPVDESVLGFYEAATSVLIGPECPIALFVGYVDDRPVATAEITLGGGVSGLFGVATLAAHRRRGYGGAVTAQALAAASHMGARTCVLQASAQGEPVYARLGFRPHGRYREFKRVNP